MIEGDIMANLPLRPVQADRNTEYHRALDEGREILRKTSLAAAMADGLAAISAREADRMAEDRPRLPTEAEYAALRRADAERAIAAGEAAVGAEQARQMAAHAERAADDAAQARQMAEDLRVLADAARAGAAAVPAAAEGAPINAPGEWVRSPVVRARFEGRFPTVDAWLREASRNVAVAGAGAYMRKQGARWEYELRALEAHFNKCGMLKDPVPVVGGARTIHRCR